MIAFAFAFQAWARGKDRDAQKDAFFDGGLLGIGLGLLIYLGLGLITDLY